MLKAASVVLVVAIAVGGGCAAPRLTGECVAPAGAFPSKHEVPPKVVISFVSNLVYKPSGLSALRMGALAPTVGNESVNRVFGQAAQLIVEKRDPAVLPRFAPALAASPVSGATHVMLVVPRKILTNVQTTQADLDIDIVDPSLKQTLWKGGLTITITSKADSGKHLADELYTTLMQLGLTTKPLVGEAATSPKASTPCG